MPYYPKLQAVSICHPQEITLEITTIKVNLPHIFMNNYPWDLWSIRCFAWLSEIAFCKSCQVAVRDEGLQKKHHIWEQPQPVFARVKPHFVSFSIQPRGPYSRSTKGVMRVRSYHHWITIWDSHHRKPTGNLSISVWKKKINIYWTYCLFLMLSGLVNYPSTSSVIQKRKRSSFNGFKVISLASVALRTALRWKDRQKKTGEGIREG